MKTIPKATVPKTTTSSHGGIVRYIWATDDAGNKTPGTTSTFMQMVM